jgi:excinuclease ABC subunit B
VAEKEKTYQAMTATQLMEKIADMEKQMFEFARELEFEKAANLRDDIEQLRKQVVSLS